MYFYARTPKDCMVVHKKNGKVSVEPGYPSIEKYTIVKKAGRYYLRCSQSSNEFNQFDPFVFYVHIKKTHNDKKIARYNNLHKARVELTQKQQKECDEHNSRIKAENEARFLEEQKKREIFEEKFKDHFEVDVPTCSCQLGDNSDKMVSFYEKYGMNLPYIRDECDKCSKHCKDLLAQNLTINTNIYDHGWSICTRK